jgi:hypothetical protein
MISTFSFMAAGPMAFEFRLIAEIAWIAKPTRTAVRNMDSAPENTGLS